MSIEGGPALLRGWTVRLSHDAAAPLRGAAGILAGFGAEVVTDGGVGVATLRTHAAGGRMVDVRLVRWCGEAALRGGPPNGTTLTSYAALRIAGAAARAARRGIDAQLLSDRLSVELCGPCRLSGGIGPELLRCRDGWIVVRWRDEDERELFRALTGGADQCSRDEAVAAGRLGRLLVAPVCVPHASSGGLGCGSLTGHGRSARGRPRVVDWSVLWAGPWATAQLRRGGSHVHRIEHPRRRDGLLSFAAGRRWWRSLNGAKRTELLDAREPDDRGRIEQALRDADVLVTSMTPRALHSLGFDDRWREAHAPHLLHLELVAYEAPWSDAPGLGEHASAQAGLLWRAGRPPAEPRPWADSLLGAAALSLAEIWLASDARPGGRVRLSLERAAGLALGVARGGQLRNEVSSICAIGTM